jgi:hypothetical protein
MTSSSVDTLLEIPVWAKKLLNLDEMTVYINSHDNTDYLVYDDTVEMIAPITECNPWGGVDYDKSVYEAHQPIVYLPPPPPPPIISPEGTHAMNHKTTTPKPPFRSSNENHNNNNNNKRHAASTLKSMKRRRKLTVEDGRMLREEFVANLSKLPEEPDVGLLCRVYSLLDGFKITPQVMDVVTALVQFVHTDSLENTMGYKKRSKTFKAQLGYLLVGLSRIE